MRYRKQVLTTGSQRQAVDAAKRSPMNVEIAAMMTIVVPILNRHAYLLKLLKYYRATCSTIMMKILDSSDEALEHPDLEQLIRSAGVVYDKNLPIPAVKMI